jgi:hypothetical protein
MVPVFLCAARHDFCAVRSSMLRDAALRLPV